MNTKYNDDHQHNKDVLLSTPNKENLDCHNIDSDKETWKYFKEFADNTNLDGVKYTIKTDKPIPASFRIWWAIMVILSFCIGSYLIWEVWEKWERSPVIVSFAETSTPIWQIPYPAITICPMSKFYKADFNYSKVCTDKLNSTEKKLKLYDVLGMMCLEQCMDTRIRKVETVSVADLESVIENYCLKDDDTLAMCYKKKEFECYDLFTPIITDSGLCYTYNMLGAEDIYKENVYYNKKNHLNTAKSKGWTMEGGYEKGVPFNTYPARGSKTAINLILKYNTENVDYRCNGIYRGFQIIIHAPNTIPKPKENFVWIPVKLQTIIMVKPQMITSSGDIKKYKPKSRGCFLSSERQLKYFKEYSQSNCDTECLTDYTIAVCGCVPYYMPRLHWMPICSSAKYACVTSASENYEAMSELGTDGDEEDKATPAQQCNCLPCCTTLDYDVEISQVKLEWKNFVNAMVSESSNTTPSMVSSVKIAFKSAQFIPSKRSELYGLTDFLANCGGLIGVCTGFSLLSLVEIFYFFVIRVLWDVKQKYFPKRQ